MFTLALLEIIANLLSEFTFYIYVQQIQHTNDKITLIYRNNR